MLGQHKKASQFGPIKVTTATPEQKASVQKLNEKGQQANAAGNLAEAEKAFSEGASAAERVYGADSLNVAIFFNNLATAQSGQDKLGAVSCFR